jgi:hypothetical protein
VPEIKKMYEMEGKAVFKVCKSVHDHTIQINHQPNATIFFQFIILTFIYSSTCFGRFPAHHQEFNDCSSSLWFLPSYRGDSRAVFVVGPAGRPWRVVGHVVAGRCQRPATARPTTLHVCKTRGC